MGTKGNSPSIEAGKTDESILRAGGHKLSVHLNPPLVSILVTGMEGGTQQTVRSVQGLELHWRRCRCAHFCPLGIPALATAAAGSFYGARVQGAQSARACGGSLEAHLRLCLLPKDFLLTVLGEECRFLLFNV